MNILDLFSDLSYGELSNLPLAGEGDGQITDSGKPKVIRALNEGMIRLYTRFALREKNVIIGLVDHITNYQLDSKFAESNAATSTQPYLYIKDLNREPFTDDVVRILSVWNSDGYPVPLNDEHNIYSVFTPEDKVLLVPRPITGKALVLGYQALPEKLSEDDLTAEVKIPVVLEGALRAFIAYKIYSQMNTQEAQGIASSHLNMFNGIAQDVIDQDLVSSSKSTTNTKFKMRGFV